MRLHFFTSTARRLFISLAAFTICMLAAPGAHSQENSFQSSHGGILLITPQTRENPSALLVKLPGTPAGSQAVFSLYTLNGRKILEKALDKIAPGAIIPGNEIFGERIGLAAGYYIYQMSDSEPGNAFFSPTQLYFNEVSQTHLPGDSLPAAFTEFTDVTGDSFPDIILGINTFISLEQPQIFVNDGSGHFSNETAARFPLLQLFVNDVAVFDADSDGDRDIYFAADDGTGGFINTDKLWLNNGQGFFSDVSATHLPPLPVISTNADWGFINPDPYPDLLLNPLVGSVFSPFVPAYVLINDGSGHFSDQSSALIPQASYNSYDAVLADVNKDSLNDIVLACLGDNIITDPQGNPIDTLSGRNAVFTQNSDGTFSDETETRMPDIVRWSKLLKVADINNDGAVDLYSIDIGFSVADALNVLYVNSGSGYFSDETASRLPPETVIWNNDAEFADYNRNGFADMFMINVVLGGPAADVLYFNSGGFFSDQSAHLPQIIDFNASTAVADMERDGDTDIFISVAPESLGTGVPTGLPDLLYENIIPPVGLEPEPLPVSGNLKLFQNYPNPFNPETAISYQLSALSYVELAVFGVSGQKVATLARKQLPPGEYEVNWNGRNDFGKPVASGIYIYRLRAGQFEQSKKMLLLR